MSWRRWSLRGASDEGRERFRDVVAERPKFFTELRKTVYEYQQEKGIQRERQKYNDQRKR